MKIYYCVTTVIYDNGRITANFTGIVESNKKPENTYNCTKTRDIYNDWFETLEEANEFIEEARRA